MNKNNLQWNMPSLKSIFQVIYTNYSISSLTISQFLANKKMFITLNLCFFNLIQKSKVNWENRTIFTISQYFFIFELILLELFILLKIRSLFLIFRFILWRFNGRMGLLYLTGVCLCWYLLCWFGKKV